jgi:predicted CoA-binding protein
MFENPTDDELRRLLTLSNTIAVVGRSSDSGHASYPIMQGLQNDGFHVMPVSPGEREMDLCIGVTVMALGIQ